MGRAQPPSHVTPARMQEELDELCLGGQVEQAREALFKARARPCNPETLEP